MKSRAIAVLLAALTVVLMASLAFGAPWRGWRGSGGWGMGGSYNRLYNPATVETVAGEVLGIEKVTPRKGMYYAIQIVVKTDQESIPVHLGPGWYIERLDTKIAKGDQVEVKGSRVTIAGKPVVIAAEVKKGDETLKLRDDNGIPAWAGWRR